MNTEHWWKGADRGEGKGTDRGDGKVTDRGEGKGTDRVEGKGTDKGDGKHLNKNLHQCHMSTTTVNWTGPSSNSSR
jgi:hypothetical protein